MRPTQTRCVDTYDLQAFEFSERLASGVPDYELLDFGWVVWVGTVWENEISTSRRPAEAEILLRSHPSSRHPGVRQGTARRMSSSARAGLVILSYA
mgnify:CR=1 FL=1